MAKISFDDLPSGVNITFDDLPEDKYRTAARQEFDALKAKGVPVDAGLGRRAAQGMTFGAADEILAGLNTPIEMYRAGTLDPREGYNRAKAWEDIRLEKAREGQGLAGHAAEVTGGVVSGGGLAKAGYSLVPRGAGLARRMLGYGAEGAGYGGASGFLDSGNSLDERLAGAAKGAGAGAAVGVALPVATGLAGTVFAPVVSNIRARFNPQGVASSQVARAIDESGRPIGDVASDVRMAAQEGQPQFTLADALGNPGQRMLSGVARSPGEGRTAVVEFLEQRQAGQGRRLAQQLAEGFQAPQTAARTTEALTAARGAEADINYGAARGAAGSVNATPAIEAADRVLRPGVNRILPETGIADNSVEAAVRRARGYLADGRGSQLSNFDDALAAKRELDAMIESANPTVQRALIPIRNALDNQLAETSSAYANARNTFRERSRVIEAVGHGTDAAKRGRTEDTIPAFRSMNPGQQSAFRVGYAEPYIEQIQGAAVGANKARPFTSDAFREESQAIAPLSTGNRMSRQIGRENTMFETRRQATGGSQTADNLADQDALKIDPGIVSSLLRGDVIGAGRDTLRAISNGLHGSTPAVREHIARLLLQRGSPTIERDLARELRSLQRNSALGNALARGLITGSAVSLPAHSR